MFSSCISTGNTVSVTVADGDQEVSRVVLNV